MVAAAAAAAAAEAEADESLNGALNAITISDENNLFSLCMRKVSRVSRDRGWPQRLFLLLPLLHPWHSRMLVLKSSNSG